MINLITNNFCQNQINSISKQTNTVYFKSSSDRIDRFEKTPVEENQRLTDAINRIGEDKVRPATAEDYSKWVEGFMEKGGKPEYYCNTPITDATDIFLVAKKDFTVPKLYGAQAVNLIIPKDINIDAESGELGHSTLYFMKDFSITGKSKSVKIYSDTHSDKFDTKIEKIVQEKWTKRCEAGKINLCRGETLIWKNHAKNDG